MRMRPRFRYPRSAASALARGLPVGPVLGPVLGLGLVLGLAGCVISHEARQENRRASHSAHGETITFRYNSGPAAELPAAERPGSGEQVDVRTAELLEVRDDGVLIGADSAIQYIPLDRLVFPEITDPATYRVRARYPRGLTDAQLQRLLQAVGAERVDTLGVEPVDTADPAVLEAFLRQAEAAAEPYRSLEHAVASGFRRLGPAFPGMGEHWIHPGRIVAGHINPARPPVLCYAPVDGEHRLIALAFTVPLEADEPPPAYPAGRGAWHDHGGHVDEETLLLIHRHSHQGADGPRLAMFHAWLWLDNPDGVLAQNNWRLPFLQAGLDAHGLRPSADAARALSLHTAGADYYLALFRAAAALEPGEVAALSDLLDRRAHTARAWAAAAPAGEPLDVAALTELEALWADVWAEIAATVRASTWEALSMLRDS
jgi:hypothetical protein